MRYYKADAVIDDMFTRYHVVTNKYDIFYIPSMDRLAICKSHWLWSRQPFYYYKDTEYLMKLDGKLAFQILPHFDEFRDCLQWMSEELINQKIERLLKLRAFL